MCRRYIHTLLLMLLPMLACAQTMPSLRPEVTYTNPEGQTLTGSFPDDLQLTEIQNAPLNGVFLANPIDAEGWDVSYDWVVMVDTVTGSMGNNYFELVHRFEENLDYDFIHKGQYKIRLKATFTNGNVTWHYPTEDMDSIVFTLSISGSLLTFPNTFTPNGDGQNDVLKAKEYQSIVEFHAAVFNRWGQRLYQWDDMAEGWDGRYGGNYVRNGAYYLVVNAKGADGTKYRIKKTINVFTHKAIVE
ncbi:MAG: gliding motility-associated C-terminal domain-containing protein [Bacteroidaceae bacterium]|nr:gliding motility-associated C-terminal domain-containing protein [Bacteroidaceae bacterium]